MTLYLGNRFYLFWDPGLKGSRDHRSAVGSTGNPPSRDIALSTGSVVLVPLDASHLDGMWAAMAESAAALRSTMPWWRDEQTKNDMVAWTSFTESAWRSGTLYAFSILDAADER